ncbi:MAG: M24 family metallopeptidase [Firmicutes bacterium]|nr:M24 family metallopeptidase [Bacillota bacterium]
MELEHWMLTHGGEGISFDTICVSGAKSSYPHGVPGDKKIEDGDFVTMDYGTMVGGYHADMTRTVAIGHATDEMKKVYETVRLAQQTCCDKIHAGMKGDECHKIAADIIAAAGYGEYFGHGLGHGTGLEIHESPRFSPLYPKVILENTIMSIEPGIYLPGKFGVRIEDLCIVKADGIINLTLTAPKELIII